ncbi:GreA/GreB family elongation factor [Sphingomonas sp. M1-B02]|uniref:GreA/GreB family elongation factor n=1 Tax=Sphingomonas sp. M1-B02 TaxID=3114300 RepID=UPI00223F0EA3|nr:GreA/GreB family elongation factor [Sphingomonas sp. S6-11]UZK64763.1 GreA/GreB family elongation factor [Sphingomonas sp. S6-11]
MSVAFRRESDEEHLEPKFELPLPAGPNMVTARGFAMIEARVAELEDAITAETEDAAREDRKRQLRYWKTRRATARVAPPPEAGVVGIGARVRIRMAGKERLLDIVGHDEADPAADRIAFSAPLAHALIGAEVSEKVDFNGKVEAIEVLGSEAIPD